MSRTRAELTTRALIAHSPAVLVTRVEENSNIVNTDWVPFNFFASNVCVRGVATHFQKQWTLPFVFKCFNHAFLWNKPIYRYFIMPLVYPFPCNYNSSPTHNLSFLNFPTHSSLTHYQKSLWVAALENWYQYFTQMQKSRYW